MGERRAILRHAGGMRFEAETGTGRRIVFGDEAEAGELSPVETMAAGLAACTGMDVVSILVKKRLTIDSYTVTVEANQRDAYPQVFTRVDLLHELVGPRVTEAALRRCIELSATRYCPVSAMLSAGATEIHHRYRIRRTGPEPLQAEGEVIVTGPYRRPDVLPEPEIGSGRHT
jgi:putative redox protein